MGKNPIELIGISSKGYQLSGTWNGFIQIRNNSIWFSYENENNYYHSDAPFELKDKVLNILNLVEAWGYTPVGPWPGRPNKINLKCIRLRA